MSCRYCLTNCEGACLPLEQIRVKTFPTIFDPAFTREKQARGYAAVLKAFQIRNYSEASLAVLTSLATERAGKKTVARALEMLDDPFICEVAQRMAEFGFREREPFKLHRKEIIQ